MAKVLRQYLCRFSTRSTPKSNTIFAFCFDYAIPPVQDLPQAVAGAPADTAETPPESIPEIGVALPEDWRQEPSEGLDEHDSEESEKLAELANPSKRVLGPALPPQILLDQAAEVAEAVSQLADVQEVMDTPRAQSIMS